MSAIAQLWPKPAGSPDPAVLYAAVQAFPESLAIVASGLMVYANPAWCRMFECADPSQLQGRAVEDFVPVSEAAPDAEGGTYSAEDFVHARSDGTGLQIEVTRAAFRNRGNDFQVLSTHDVSRQKQAESRLRESQRMEAVGRLVGGVAHDFNNLLTGIMLYCDLLIAELEKNSRASLHAQEMRMAGEQGAALVQQLLDVARPPAGEAREFALNDVVTGNQDMLTRLIGEHIVLTTSLSPDLGAVMMDPAQLQQILLNLVLNARDAMPGGGQITVATRNVTGHLLNQQEQTSQPTPCVELTVTDTGCGMDSETLGRAFEPFFTTKKTGGGNGLGLANAYRLARQEGGTIIAESQPGRGTRVSLRLPRCGPDTPSNLKAKR